VKMAEPEGGAVERACFATRRRVEFSDTDVAGIVHFSRFFVFMESAEHQFLNALGTSVHAQYEGHVLGWPRLTASCEFIRPARFEDTVDILLSVQRLGRKSVTYDAEFRLGEDLIARGRMTSVCCVLEEGKPPRSVSIPEDLAGRILAARIVE